MKLVPSPNTFTLLGEGVKKKKKKKKKRRKKKKKKRKERKKPCSMGGTDSNFLFQQISIFFSFFQNLAKFGDF